MGCKLVSKKDENVIPMCELKGGQVAVVMEGDTEGWIVQRESTGNMPDFVAIGKEGSGEFESDGYGGTMTLLVRVLQKGEMIEIT